MAQEKMGTLSHLLLNLINNSVMISGAQLVDAIHADYTVHTYTYPMIQRALHDLVQYNKVQLFKVNPAKHAIDWTHDMYAPLGTHVFGTAVGTASSGAPTDLDSIDLKAEDADRIDALLMSAVYRTALVFERLENAGRIQGNGHHMAQTLAGEASKLFRERLIK